MSEVYLLHFREPYRHAQHYIGFCSRGLDSRMAYHRRGSGSRLLRAVVRSGGDWVVARVWPDRDRAFERSLKVHGAARYCPICRADDRLTKARAERLRTDLRRAGWRVASIHSRPQILPPYRGRRWWLVVFDPEGRPYRIGSYRHPALDAVSNLRVG